MGPAVEIQGIQVPGLIYGTAWKEDDTARLTASALREGFRGIDTANQRKHYHEAAVGDSVKAAIESGQILRKDLFLQTKFTFVESQDDRLPYKPSDPVAAQVGQSFHSSLEHFGVDTLDAYLLHGPTLREDLADRDWQAWHAMEELHRAGRARLLGVSNVTRGQLEELYRGAGVKPALVQNRVFRMPHADRDVRSFCRAKGIGYEAFSLLTAAPQFLRHPAVHSAAVRLGATPQQIVFRFAMQAGMIALTGTTNEQHMRQDLAVHDFALDASDVAAITRLVEG